MRAPGAEREPDDRAARVRVPVRGAEASERGHEVHAIVAIQRSGQRLRLGRAGDDAEPVAQPLHGRAGDEDRCLERVRARVADAPRQRRHKPGRRRRHGEARVQQHERAGAVGVLAHARIHARLPEQRGLLVPRRARQRRGVAVQRLRTGVAEDPGARQHARQRPLGNPEQLQQLGVPAPGVNVVQHRARGVGAVGHVLPRELEGKPRVDGAEHGAAGEHALAQAVDVFEQPLDLGGAEVRVEHQPGALPNQLLVARRAQLIAAGGGAAVLPHDRAVQGLAARWIPHAHRLALVGHAHREQLALGHAGIGERLPGHGLRQAPELIRVVLHPARPGKVLGELAVGAADRLGTLVEHQAGRARGSLVDGEDHS